MENKKYALEMESARMEKMDREVSKEDWKALLKGQIDFMVDQMDERVPHFDFCRLKLIVVHSENEKGQCIADVVTTGNCAGSETPYFAESVESYKEVLHGPEEGKHFDYVDCYADNVIPEGSDFDKECIARGQKLTGRILDFGSGIGEYDDFTGADSVDDDSLEDPEEGQQILKKHTPNGQCFKQWVTTGNPLPVPDDYYNVIRMGYSWGWMGENFEKTGPELVRILAPGGMLVIFDAAINKEDHGIGTLKELEEHMKKSLPGCTVFVEGSETDEGLEFNVIAHK